MLSVSMKLAVLWLYILHLAFVSAGLLSRIDQQNAKTNMSVGLAQAPQSTGSLNPSRQRLFARRGQYKRQRIHVPKPKVVPVTPNDIQPPNKVDPKPAKPNCSQMTQSCLPQSGCCDLSASCHCRFFNAICFCRKIV
ncbi:agouti-signaling protein-like [Centropristis striata]|uniref:agouti-signaling protein-like n=1 Tax=Centropristis striata TaxID=184440 RepID=UPI0027E0B672|nr:agouti-signaling protein-like [Centropristis striata]